MMLLPFADRAPTPSEVERIRLILSTYQDGTGMLALGGRTLPGWRDFERTVALAVGGVAQESKALFDVLLFRPGQDRPQYGLSCKMRSELPRVARDGRVTIELANAAGEFWGALEGDGVSKATLASNTARAGAALSTVVHRWHQAMSHQNGGTIDLTKSSYLVLLWDRRRLEYELFQFPLDLWDPARLSWSAPSGARLCGNDGAGNLVEWYHTSGSQLKFYPLATNAIWRSGKFMLEPLPSTLAPMVTKAASYFPEKWAATSQETGIR